MLAALAVPVWLVLAACASLASAQALARDADAPGSARLVRESAVALDTTAVAPDELPLPKGVMPGDPARGRLVVLDRQKGLCLLCHTGPFAQARFQGNLAPDLGDVGDRLGEAQLRLRISDPKRLNPASIMPSYGRTDGYTRVAPAWAGRPVLEQAQIEDVVAFLLTLKATR